MIELDNIPADQMIARGKLATCNREIRSRQRKLTEAMQGVVDNARTVVRLLDGGGPSPAENVDNISAIIKNCVAWARDLDQWRAFADEFEKAAWPKEKK